MIVPSIDLQGGQTVQLVGGREKALDAGDPRPIAERFARVGEVAVIDLDAALGTGDQTEVIRELLEIAPCRVGGGIRDYDRARQWLDAGAHKIIIGTAAQPDLLKRLPRDRVIVALDAQHGEVVVKGWREKTGVTIEQRLAELREFVDAFLITFVEREGRLVGLDLERTTQLVECADGARITFAGGVTTAEEIADLDALGADAQIGMALYRGIMDLTAGFAAPLTSDRPDGLWPTIVQEADGSVLGLCYSSERSLREAIDSGRGVYESRKRGLWIKGATSGAVQQLVSVSVDCDRDTLRFVVRQSSDGFCHRGTWSCFDDTIGLPNLVQRLKRRFEDPPPGSYTDRLLRDPDLLRAKLVEEAGELAEARDSKHVAAEVADVLYFASVAMLRGGAELEDVWRELDRRARKVTRRPGDAKPAPEEGR